MPDYHVQENGLAVITFDALGSFPIIGNTAGVDTSDNRIDNRSAVTVKNYTLNVYNNTRTVTSTFRDRKNGTNGSVAISISSSTTGWFEDNTNTTSISVGDDTEIMIDSDSSNSGRVDFNTSAIMTTTDQRIFINTSRMNSTSMSDSTTYYMTMSGSPSTLTTTEDDVERRVKVAGTFKNMQIDCSTHRGDTGTLRTRINNSNGNSVISITGSGKLQDTTNTDTISVDDDINFSITSGTGSGTYRAWILGGQWENTNDKFPLITGNQVPTSISFNVTYYGGFGSGAVSNTTEGNTEARFRTPIILNNLSTRVTTNTITTSATTFKIRKNQADGNSSISVSASSTGYFEDTTNSDSFVDQDEGCFSVVAPNTSGALSYNYVQTVMSLTAPQFARPDGDQSVGSWEDEGGATTNLYQSIDEIVASDSDYVRSEQNPATNSKYECTLSNVTDPQVSTGHIVRYRYRKNNGNQTINMVIRLKQGGTTIASQTHNGVSTTWTDGSFTLTGGEADNITDYTDLRIEVEADVP